MSLRQGEENNETDPTYEEDSGSFTLKLHVGGKFVHSPEAMYSGGKTYIYDYVNLEDVSLLYFDVLCDLAGVLGSKKYHKLKDGGFVLIRRDRDLHKYCEDSGRIVDLYVEVDINVLIQRQWDSVGGVAAIEENDDESLTSGNQDEGEIGSDAGSIGSDAGSIGFDDNHDDDETDEVRAGEMANEMAADKANDMAADKENYDTDEGSIDLGESLHELPSIHVSDEEDDATTTRNLFNPNRDMQDPELSCGMEFSDLSEFKEAVRNFSIKRGRPIKFVKSEANRRSRATCKKSGCPWSVYAVVSKKNGKAVIRTYDPNHKCSFSYRNPNVKSTWLAKKYLRDFAHDPKSNMTNFRNRMVHDTRCHISKSTSYRARKKALELIRGKEEDQYALIHDYMAEIIRTDRSAKMKLKTCVQTREEVDPATLEALMGHDIPAIIDSPRFQRLYCCLSAPKHGMKAACRPIFGVDGCSLKHKFGGILLTAVGIDPNNNLYPFAYAAVEGETKDSWTWFLDLVRDDLGIERDHEWTIMSDKQKGLIQACELVFPGADHRFCVRHLHTNWANAGFTGETLKLALYNAANATTVQEFERAMTDLAKIDKDAAEWLEDKPPAHWSRSHFSVMSKCDILLNNLCENFNSVIGDARPLPLLSMFEWIRNYLMVRFQENRERAMTNWSGKKLCPKIQIKLKKNMESAADSIPQRADTNKYECHQFDGRQFVVNLEHMTCSCRRWDLTGIPCAHACAALGMAMKDPEDFVHQCYTLETYLSAYSLTVEPVSGLMQLRQTGNEPVLPPLIKRQPGRPKKRRIKSKGEDLITKDPKGKQKLLRRGTSCVCSVCKKPGHNKRRCPDVIGSQSATPSSDVAQQSSTSGPNVGELLPRKRKTLAAATQANKNRLPEPSSTIDLSQSAPPVEMTQFGLPPASATSNLAHQVDGGIKNKRKRLATKKSMDPASKNVMQPATKKTMEPTTTSSMEPAPLVFPYYRTVKDNPNPVPSFMVRNGTRYLPRSLIPAAMALVKKPSGNQGNHVP